MFVREQPDLNWRSPACRDAIMRDAVYYWLERGVDGYRIDVANFYSKPKVFEDAPIKNPDVPFQDALEYVCNGPEMHEYMRLLGSAFEKYNAMTVGELGTTPPAQILDYVGASRKEMAMVFQFDQLDVDLHPGFDRLYARKWKLPECKKLTAQCQQLIEGTDAWTTAFLENHDWPRIVSHLGNDSPEHRVACAKMFATLLFVETGTVFLYQGQEIGMINVPKTWTIDDYRDIDAHNFYNDQIRLHGQKAASKALGGLQHMSRDNARTPMQWDTTKNAGFSSAEPWISVHDEYSAINVAKSEDDEQSVLNYTRELIQSRSMHKDLFVYGLFRVLDHDNEQVFTFTKVDPNNHSSMSVVVLNFTADEQRVPELAELQGLNIECGTNPRGVLAKDVLGPFEARIYG